MLALQLLPGTNQLKKERLVEEFVEGRKIGCRSIKRNWRPGEAGAGQGECYNTKSYYARSSSNVSQSRNMAESAYFNSLLAILGGRSHIK